MSEAKTTYPIHKWFLIAISVFLMFGNRLFPTAFGLNAAGVSILCIFLGAMILLLFVNLAWPLLLCLLAYPVCGVYTISEALNMTLGSSVFWLVLLSGMLVSVLDECGVIKRIAIYFLNLRFVKKSPWIFVGTLFLCTLLIGSIMDPTALIVVMTALTGEILNALGVKKGDRFGEMLMLGILVFVGLSFGTTPIAHAVPMVIMPMFANVASINFLQYSIPGYISHLLFFVIYMLTMKYIFKVDVSCVKNADLSELQNELGPMSKRAIISSIIYVGVILLWFLPNMLQGVFPGFYEFMNSLGEVSPLIAGTAAMCIIRVEGKPVMDLVTQIKTGAPWTACFPVATALILGGSLSNPEAGIIDMISTAATPTLSHVSPFVFVIIICCVATLVTNFTSNTVTATLLSTISVALIEGGAISGVNAGALCFCIGATTALAFTTPPGSAYATIVQTTGWLPMKKQISYGSFYALLGLIVTVLVAYPIGCLVM